MGKQTINNGDTMGQVRSDLNSNFDELYSQVDDLVTNSLTVAELTNLRNFLSNWTVTSDGSLIPNNNNSSDIGNATNKGRDIYEHI